MRKYQGELIHCSHDAMGVIEVVEQGQLRSLHFGTEARQSAMLLHDPLYLALNYTRAMCSALLLCDAPQNILLLGLGAGSLAKFLLHHYPHCVIDAVELRPQVFQVARSFFALPESPRLHLHFEDAASFIRTRPSEQPAYNTLLVDAFVDSGIAESVCGHGFFYACHAHLSAEGILAMNLWGDDPRGIDEIIIEIEAVFGQPVLRLPVEGRANIIVLASSQPGLVKRLGRLEERARHMEQQSGIEFLSLLRTLRKVNKPHLLHLW